MKWLATYAMRTSATITIALSMLFSSATAFAGSEQSDDGTGIWAQMSTPEHKGEASWKLYLPLTAQHIHSYYSESALKRLNEANLGIGFGRSHIRGSVEHEWYAIGFNDSLRKLQANVGYNVTYRWYEEGLFYTGVGATVGLTTRDNLNNGIPTPYILPTAKVGFGDWELSALYIPNVNKVVKPLVFIWASYKF